MSAGDPLKQTNKKTFLIILKTGTGKTLIKKRKTQDDVLLIGMLFLEKTAITLLTSVEMQQLFFKD